MTVFVDTSALLAILDRDDRHHEQAAATWQRVLDSETEIVTSNYVLVELFALVQRRLGVAALRAIALDLLPALRVAWVDREEHDAAVSSLLAASRRKLSLVDCTSFALMRQQGIEHVFAFDRHFQELGFRKYA